MENAALSRAREEYALVENNYIEALRERGLEFAPAYEDVDAIAELRHKLEAKGVAVRNAGASLSYGFLSKACVECTGNNGSETFSTTFKCHRDCYFCFNRNQVDYEKFFREGCPWREGLERSAIENDTLACIGLTGGEPLLDFESSIEFLKEAKSKFPDAHLRMYTSGDLLTLEQAQRLAQVGLNEIRFSVKDDDPPSRQDKVLSAMRLAKDYIPSVMVEMPIIPGSEDHVKALLKSFDEIGIDGMNMLEFCFPFSNWEDFRSRGFKLKNPPFEVMYDYGYSGGLAVAGSELLILKLMDWAIDEGIEIGLHYCSLENKHRSEIRQKDERARGLQACLTFDEDDFFMKAGRVFGEDVELARKVLSAAGCEDIIESEKECSLTFPLEHMDAVCDLVRADGSPIEPQVVYFVYEVDDDGGFFIDVAIEDAF